MEQLQLEYFETVAKTSNISKAAEMLFISQSSLSQTIKRLENEIGYPLFERNGKHISLNQNGVIFLNCVREMKKSYKSAIEEINEKNDNYKHELNIHMGCASLFLPRLMVYLKKNTNNVLFRISQWNYDTGNDDNADLKIIAASEPLDMSNASLLLEENILLALPHNHPLLKKKSISTSDLTREEFISLNPAWSLEQVITNQCDKMNFHPIVSIRVDNPAILRQLLCENLGIALIPEKTWGKSFAKGVLDLRKVSDLSIKRYVYLLWQEGFLKENVKQCIPLIQEFFQKHVESDKNL